MSETIHGNNFDVVAQAAMGFAKIEDSMRAESTKLIIQKIIDQERGNPLPGKFSKEEKETMERISQVLGLFSIKIN